MIFGGLAVMVIDMTLDPWLCVTGFHRVCLYRISFYIGSIAPITLQGAFNSFAGDYKVENFYIFSCRHYMSLFHLSVLCLRILADIGILPSIMHDALNNLFAHKHHHIQPPQGREVNVCVLAAS